MLQLDIYSYDAHLQHRYGEKVAEEVLGGSSRNRDRPRTLSFTGIITTPAHEYGLAVPPGYGEAQVSSESSNHVI